MDPIRAATARQGCWRGESRAFMCAINDLLRSARVLPTATALDPMHPTPRSQSPRPVAPPSLLR